MADQDNGASDTTLRADPMNLTSSALIEMLVLENFKDFSEMIKQIMLRFIGDQPLTEEEQMIADYINSAALAREKDRE